MATISLASVHQSKAEDRVRVVNNYLSSQAYMDSQKLNTLVQILARRNGILSEIYNRVFSSFKVQSVLSDLPTSCPSVKILSLDSADELGIITSLFSNIEELTLHGSHNWDMDSVSTNCKNLRRLEIESAEYIKPKMIKKLTERCTQLKTLILKNCACLNPEEERSLSIKGITVVQVLPSNFERDAEGILWGWFDPNPTKVSDINFYPCRKHYIGKSYVCETHIPLYEASDIDFPDLPW